MVVPVNCLEDAHVVLDGLDLTVKQVCSYVCCCV